MNKKEFLDNVTDQISYRPLRPEIRRELDEHIQDRAEEYEMEGLSAQEAEDRAVSAMGDAVSIGVQINAVRHIQKSPLLILMTLILMAAGAGAAAYLSWLPEQSSNGFLYYIPGMAVFFLTLQFGYPFFIRFRKALAVLLAAVLIVCMLLIKLCQTGVLTIWGVPFHSLLYFSLLLAVLLVPLLLYRFGRKNPWVFLVLAAGCALLCLLCFRLEGRQISSACLIVTMAAAGTGIFAAYKNHRSVPDARSLLPTGLSLFFGILLMAVSHFLFPMQQYEISCFLRPETQVTDKSNDTYNSVLIRELLLRTPAWQGLSLTPAEMMDYGTGRWYFAERNPDLISLVRSDFPDEESFREAWQARPWSAGAVYYDETNVSLYRILPQHYHNNYLISLFILQHGWICGILLVAVLAGYYLLLFSRILKIRQPLAVSLAFCCGLCLLGQAVLYLLGNFGFQFGTFPVLPLLSEGRISILVNMLLLGFILSAYRYDRVSGISFTKYPARCASDASCRVYPSSAALSRS